MNYLGEMKVYSWKQIWMVGYYDEVCERIHWNKLGDWEYSWEQVWVEELGEDE